MTCLLTIIVNDGNLMNRLLPNDRCVVARIFWIKSDLDEEDLIRFPLIIIDDLYVNKLVHVAGLEHHGRLNRDVVLLGLGCTVNGLNPGNQRVSKVGLGSTSGSLRSAHFYVLLV